MGVNVGHLAYARPISISTHSGCLAQYVGVLDIPWSNVAESIGQMWHQTLNTDTGAETVLKSLDGGLSSAIIHAMKNETELRKKVSGRERDGDGLSGNCAHMRRCSCARVITVHSVRCQMEFECDCSGRRAESARVWPPRSPNMRCTRRYACGDFNSAVRVTRNYQATVVDGG